MCFFFQAEDGIRDDLVTGVQTCALPIYFRLNGPIAFLRLLYRNCSSVSPFFHSSLHSTFTHSAISRFRPARSEEHTSALQSPDHLVCRLLLEKKKREKPDEIQYAYEFST